MRVVVQRVKKASVEVGNSVVSFINHGMVILLGIEINDNENDIDWTTKKFSSNWAALFTSHLSNGTEK